RRQRVAGRADDPPGLPRHPAAGAGPGRPPDLPRQRHAPWLVGVGRAPLAAQQPGVRAALRLRAALRIPVLPLLPVTARRASFPPPAGDGQPRLASFVLDHSPMRSSPARPQSIPGCPERARSTVSITPRQSMTAGEPPWFDPSAK